MKILRNKTPKVEEQGVIQEFKKSTEWVKKNPTDSGLLHIKTKKKTTWF